MEFAHDLSDGRGRPQHRIGNARQCGDERGNIRPGIHQALVVPHDLPLTHRHGRYLGRACALIWRKPISLEIQDDQRRSHDLPSKGSPLKVDGPMSSFAKNGAAIALLPDLGFREQWNVKPG
jgi:hypothetical protein